MLASFWLAFFPSDRTPCPLKLPNVIYVFLQYQVCLFVDRYHGGFVHLLALPVHSKYASWVRYTLNILLIV